MDWNLYLNFLVAILAIINPFAIIPLWYHLSGDVNKNARNSLAILVMSVGVLGLIIFLVGGKYILQFFSIDLMVFKVAGGLLLLISGIKMLEGTNTKLQSTDDGDGTPFQQAKLRFRKILVPMVIPVIVGPGSITTVILFGTSVSNMIDYVALSIILVLTLLTLLVILLSSRYLESHVDPLVFTAITRLFGIIVTAIAFQFMLEGLGEVFPNWLNASSPVQNEGADVQSEQSQ